METTPDLSSYDKLDFDIRLLPCSNLFYTMQFIMDVLESYETMLSTVK